MSEQYTYQEFLLNCQYKEIELNKYRFMSNAILQDLTEEYTLFDYMEGCIRRKILLSQLDSIVDKETDLCQFVDEIGWIDELIIVNDRPYFNNPILEEYNANTMKAYLYRINDLGIRCYITHALQI